MTQLRTTRYQTPVLTQSYPRGVEAVFEFNGLILNDRRRPDCYRITEITGLDDPDIRDTREENPDREGETIFQSLYSGRTVTLKGRIEAGSVDELRWMEYKLQDAFDDLNTEYPLHIRYLDYREPWDDQEALTDFSYVTGNGYTNNGVLNLSNTTSKIIYLNLQRYTYTDGMVVQRYKTGNTISTGGAVNCPINLHKRLDNLNYLYARLEIDSTPAIKLFKVDAGSTVDLSGTLTGSVSHVANHSYWLRSHVKGNVFTVEFWTVDPLSPDNVDEEPTASRTITLTGGDAMKFGSGAQGRQGVGALNIQNIADWTVEEIEIMAIEPGDLVVYCKKSTKIDIPEAQNNLQPTRDFMLTLRASDPQLKSRVQSFHALTPTTNGLSFPGSGGLTFPGDSSGLVFAGFLGSITNAGRRTAFPKVRFVGPMADPALIHLASQKLTVLTATIATGSWIEVDLSKRVVFDQTGTNQYGKLSGDYEWWGLDSGTNDFSFASDGAFATNAKVELRWRHAF